MSAPESRDFTLRSGRGLSCFKCLIFLDLCGPFLTIFIREATSGHEIESETGDSVDLGSFLNEIGHGGSRDRLRSFTHFEVGSYVWPNLDSSLRFPLIGEGQKCVKGCFVATSRIRKNKAVYMFWYACDLSYVFLSIGLRDCSAILSTHCNVELKSNLAFD